MNRAGFTEAASPGAPRAAEHGRTFARSVAPMRTPLLYLAVLASVACRPSAVVQPRAPGVREHVVPVVAPRSPTALEPARAPEPARASEPEPPPTWEWAVSVLPELAEHRVLDPGAAALARFLGWFDGGRSSRVYAYLGGACHAIAGSPGSDGFYGSWRRRVSTAGDERRVTAMSLEITRGGITESGPGGVIYHRDRRGRWQEAGGFGTGCFNTLVDHSMSAADDDQATFAGYAYTLEPRCQGTETVTQNCSAGGQRRCERCTRILLHQHTDSMAWGTGKIGIGWVEPAPVDCMQPCPADEWTPLLPRLATVLAGRRFSGVLAGEGPVVFRSASGCAREQRRRKAAARTAASDPGRDPSG